MAVNIAELLFDIFTELFTETNMERIRENTVSNATLTFVVAYVEWKPRSILDIPLVPVSDGDAVYMHYVRSPLQHEILSHGVEKAKS